MGQSIPAGAWIVAVVALAVVAVLAPPLLQDARLAGERVRWGLWLGLASWGSTIGVVALVRVLVSLGGECVQGPPEMSSGACGLCTFVVLAALAAILFLFASFLLRAPWRGPPRLVVVRVLQSTAVWAAFLSMYLSCRD